MQSTAFTHHMAEVNKAKGKRPPSKGSGRKAERPSQRQHRQQAEGPNNAVKCDMDSNACGVHSTLMISFNPAVYVRGSDGSCYNCQYTDSVCHDITPCLLCACLRRLPLVLLWMLLCMLWQLSAHAVDKSVLNVVTQLTPTKSDWGGLQRTEAPKARTIRPDSS